MGPQRFVPIGTYFCESPEFSESTLVDVKRAILRGLYQMVCRLAVVSEDKHEVFVVARLVAEEVCSIRLTGNFCWKQQDRLMRKWVVIRPSQRHWVCLTIGVGPAQISPVAAAVLQLLCRLTTAGDDGGVGGQKACMCACEESDPQNEDANRDRSVTCEQQVVAGLQYASLLGEIGV